MTSPDTGTSKAEFNQKSVWRRLNDVFFGYDFFISYAWSDGRAYAVDLAERLEESGFECFLDSKSYAGGDNWDFVGSRALKKTSRLILIGSPGVLESDPVLSEIRKYTQHGRHVIPIDFEGTLPPVSMEKGLLSLIDPKILRIPEQLSQLPTGPSDEVVARIRSSFDLLTQDQRRARWFARAAAVFAAIALLAVILVFRALYQRGRAEHFKNDAIAKKTRAEEAEQDARSKQIRAEQAEQETREQLARNLWSTSLVANSQENDPVKASHAVWNAAVTSENPRWQKDATIAHHALRPLKTKLVAICDHPQVAICRMAPDGETFLSWDFSGTARIWHVSDGSPLITLEYESGIVGPIYLPDSKHVLTVSDNTGTIWNVGDGSVLAKLEHQAPILGAFIKPNENPEKIVTWDRNGIMQEWNARNGAGGRMFNHSAIIEGVRFSKSSGSFFFRTDKKVKLTPHTGTTVQFEHEESVEWAEFLPSDNRVITYDNSKIRIWDTVTGMELDAVDWTDRNPYLNNIVVSPVMPSFALLSPSGKVGVFDVDAIGQARLSAAGHHEISVSGGVYGTGSDSVKIVKRGRAYESRHTFGSTRMSTGTKAYSLPANALLLTWSLDGTARTWTQGTELFVLRHNAPVQGGEFFDESRRILTWSDDGTARIWQTNDGSQQAMLKHGALVANACVSESQRRIVTCGGDWVRLWEISATSDRSAKESAEPLVGSSTRILVWTEGSFFAVNRERVGEFPSESDFPVLKREPKPDGNAYSADRSRVLSWHNDGTAQVWNTDEDNAVRTLNSESPISGATFSADARSILTWHIDGTARLCSGIDRGEPTLLKLDGRNVVVKGAAFSPDSKRFITWGPRDDSQFADAARIWSTHDVSIEHVLTHELGITNATFSFDSKQVLTWGLFGKAELWRSADGARIASLGLAKGVESAAFSPDMRFILTLNFDGSAHIYNAADLSLTTTFDQEEPAIGGFYFDDSQRIFTWNNDRSGWIWNAANGTLIAKLRSDDELVGGFQGLPSSAARSWSLPPPTSGSPSSNLLRWEIASGTRLTSDGRVVALSNAEWQQRKDDAEQTAPAP